MARRALVLATGILLMTSGCARNRNAARTTNLQTQLLVTNAYGQPMEILLVASGATHRLGLVYPGTESRFVIPSALISSGPVEFIAQAAGNPGEVARPGPVMVRPGHLVDFTIGHTLLNSTLTVSP